MSYMLLIVEEQGQRATRDREQGEQVYQRMLNYTESLQRKGVLVSSNSLRTEATRLQARAGKLTVIDGPFTETKELIGGFFLLSCDTYEEALELARQCPAAEWARVEIRGVGPCYL